MTIKKTLAAKVFGKRTRIFFKMQSTATKWGIGLTMLLSGISTNTFAQVTNSGILNNVATQFHNQAATWGTIIQGYALWIFWTLASISLVIHGGILIFKKADIGEFFAEFVRLCLFFGIFLWLLQNSMPIGNAIINSMIKIGANASQTGATNPSGIMDIGFNIFNTVVKQTRVLGFVDNIIGYFLAAVTLIALALIAANMVLMLCAAWILLYAGIFFLGFGGSRWTSDIAINYYKSILGIGASLMTMVLMIGIAQSIINTYYNAMTPGINLNEIATIMVVALVLLLLIQRVPGLISGVITGSSIGHSGIGAYGAGHAMAAAGVAAGGVALAGSVVAGSVGWAAGSIKSKITKSDENSSDKEASDKEAATTESNTMPSGSFAEAMGSDSSTPNTVSKATD